MKEATKYPPIKYSDGGSCIEAGAIFRWESWKQVGTAQAPVAGSVGANSRAMTVAGVQ